MDKVKDPQYKVIVKGTDYIVYDLIPESVYNVNDDIDKKIIDKIRCIQNNSNKDPGWLNPMLLSFGFPIEAILFGGSRLLDLNKPDDDYDLNIILNEQDFTLLDELIARLSVPLRYIEYKGKIIHWYFSSQTKLKTNNKYYNYHKNFWIIEACYGLTNPSKIILLNNIRAFNDFYSMLTNLKATALIECKQNYYQEIKQLCESSLENLQTNIFKETYHLCVISCLLHNQPLKKEYLLELKKYGKLNLRLFLGFKVDYDSNIIQYCRNCLINLIKYFDNMKDTF